MSDIQTKIISTYTKISHFVFHYLIFLVALIVAFLLFQQLLRTSSTRTLFQTNDTLLAQKSKIIAAFNKFLQQDINDKDVKLYILQ
jgi:positive regulator of sigma E activity